MFFLFFLFMSYLILSSAFVSYRFHSTICDRRSKSKGDDLVLDHRPSGLLNLGKDISPAIPPHNFHVFF